MYDHSLPPLCPLPPSIPPPPPVSLVYLITVLGGEKWGPGVLPSQGCHTCWTSPSFSLSGSAAQLSIRGFGPEPTGPPFGLWKEKSLCLASVGVCLGGGVCCIQFTLWK